MTGEKRPPKWARRILSRVLPVDVRTHVLGDLEEVFRQRAATGIGRARLWYWREVLSFSFRFLVERLPGPERLGVSALDLRLGARMLRRSPGFTLVGGLALSVAIAVGAGYYEFIHDLVRPTLPLDEGDRVVSIQVLDVEAGARGTRALGDFVAWRHRLRSMEDLAAFTLMDRNLVTEDGMAEPVWGAEITASAFRLARVPPLLGRPLLDSDEVPGAAPVAVVGYGVWRDRFGSDPALVGRRVRVGSTTYTVVGVMPEGFGFPVRERLWVPLQADARSMEEGGGPPVRLVGRLAPGATLGSAQAELDALGLPTGSVAQRPLRARVRPYPEGLTALSNSPVLYVLNLLFVGILLVACANVATLVFARTATRESEIAVRSALGASRQRLVAQLFTEALVLVGVSAAVGLVLTRWGMEWGMRVFWEAQRDPGPFWLDDGLSLNVVAYTAALSFVAALVVGVIPALRATRPLRRGGFQAAVSGASGLRFGGMWTAVIVGQVALSVFFVPTAVEEAWSSFQAQKSAPALAAGDVLTARLQVDPEPRLAGYGDPLDGTSALAFSSTQQELSRRLVTTVGASAVTFADRLPGMAHPTISIAVEGDAAPPQSVHVAAVGDGFFAVMGGSVLAGRSFVIDDVDAGADVVVVNESFVRRVFGGGNPVGKRIREVVSDADQAPWKEIIGVVTDLRMDPEALEQAGFYRPLPPGRSPSVYLAARVGTDAASGAARLRSTAADVAPDMRVHEVLTLVAREEAGWMGLRFFGTVLALVALAAMLLSASGIYALMAFTVSRRTREIGICAALGGEPRRILGAVFGRALMQLGAGTALGCLGAIALNGSALGEQIAQEGPWLLLTVAGLMLAVGLAAAGIPARRALRIHPTQALREG